MTLLQLYCGLEEQRKSEEEKIQKLKCKENN
jgi:hypothetical protein